MFGMAEGLGTGPRGPSDITVGRAVGTRMTPLGRTRTMTWVTAPLQEFFEPNLEQMWEAPRSDDLPRGRYACPP
ncbi:MAG: hypothetical protein JWM84_3903 [Nocardioides sp.]|nr:hypothetical protein [Nocardioides sp.]